MPQSGLANVSAAIDKLVLLTQRHFDCEEWLMVKYGYPDSIRHIMEHEDLTIEIRGYRHNNIFRPQQLGLVLFNWLVSHTLMEDRPLAAYLKDTSGLAQPPIPGSMVRAFWNLANDVVSPESFDRGRPAAVSGVMAVSNSPSEDRDSQRSDLEATAAPSNRRTSRK